MSKNVALLISGYNDRAVISFCRFCKASNIPFFLVALNNEDRILLTEYSGQVIEIRKGPKLSVENFRRYKDMISKIADFNRIVIIPTTEFLNRFLLDRRNELEGTGFLVPLCDKTLYEEISDKESFGSLCSQHAIPVPEEYGSIDESKIPFVAKPKRYFNGGRSVNQRPVLVLNQAHFSSLDSKITDNEYYYQEYINGESFYLLCYFSKNGGYRMYSQKNLIQQAEGLSIIAAESSLFHQHPIADAFAHMLIKKGFTGLIMIEVKVSESHIYMIEANPRLWGPSQLILDAGMDLFDRFALDYGLAALVPKDYAVKTKYLWQGGIFQDQANNKKPVFYDYDGRVFFDEYMEWCKADIYLRPDTFQVFTRELQHHH